MEDIKSNVAHNLAYLRKAKKMTQGELAEKFNYSDKAVSKWEHGEALPDVITLQQLADFYGVSLDFLTHENTPENKKKFARSIQNQINKGVITGLAASLVWILAIVTSLGVLFIQGHFYWMSFVWAIPLTLLIMLIFNAIWGKRKWRSPIVTSFAWTLISALYLELGIDLPDNSGWQLWMLFLLGIPVTLAAILWSHLKVQPVEDEVN